MEIARTGTHLRIKPRHGFEIVVENIGLRRDDDLDGAVLAQEIGHEHLDRRLWRGGADRGDRLREMSRAAIVEIVAVDRGHDNVVEAKRGDRFADALGLVRVELIGPAGRDIAEGAGAGADGAEDHYGRVLFLPALADIRAGRLFADCVELQLAHQAARRLVFRRGRRLDADPGWLPRARLVRPRRLFGMPQRLRRGLPRLNVR